jgi:hypothetical protein
MPSSTAGEPDVVVEVGYAVGYDVQRLRKSCGLTCITRIVRAAPTTLFGRIPVPCGLLLRQGYGF